MTAGRRTVLVGERLRPGISLDAALEQVAALSGAAISLAVLDRSDGRSSVAVGVDGAGASHEQGIERIREALRGLFDEVWEAENLGEGVAWPERLT